MKEARSLAQAQGGLLKAFVSSGLVKDLIRLNVSAMRPDAGRNAVKTLMGEDPEVFLGIVSGLPVVVNSALGGAAELGARLKNTFTPELLKSFAASVAGDIDREAARECGRVWAGLAADVLRASPELRTLAVQALLARGPKILADSVNSFSRAVNGITREDPEALSRFMSAAIKDIDGKELGKAAALMANALLDQKMNLGSWAWGLVRDRVKRSLGGRRGQRA